MKRYVLALAVLVLLIGTSGVVAAESGPLADAGLDQEVGVDTTVQLDATGSSHPNGTIDAYEWSIETPDGRTIRPDCRDCPRTRFTPGQTGRYDVTVTVTDTEGRTDDDTLYVYVEAAGPTVTLDGPTEPPAGEPATYNATASVRNAELDEMTWRIDNQTVGRDAMSGASDHSERTFSFSDSGPYRLEVIVNDSRNRTARDVLVVEPESESESEPESGSEPEPEPESESDGTSQADDDRPSTGSGGSDPEADRDCVQAAAVGTDYVCIKHEDHGGSEDLVPEESGEVCDGTDLSTCETIDAPAGGVSRGSDSDIGGSHESDESNTGTRSASTIPKNYNDNSSGLSDNGSDSSGSRLGSVV